jgi:phospholipid/cholesterol/gamma-HCH transport system substrate-binding protein
VNGRVHRNEVRQFLFGIATLAVAAVVFTIGWIVQTGGPVPGKAYTYVRADFNNVGTLKAGKDVKQNGIRVGQVSKVEYNKGIAEVTLRLEGDRRVYRDAVVQIGNVSALGKKYVAFDPGTAAAGILADGVLPASQNVDATSLEDALSALDPATRTALRSTLEQTGGGLAGHGEDLRKALNASPRLLRDLKQISAAIDDPDAQLPELLQAADTLVGRFTGREDELRSLMRSAEQTLTAVGVDQGTPLESTIEEAPNTLKNVKTATDALNEPLADLDVALRQVKPGGVALGASSGDLRGFLRDSVTALDKVPDVSEEAKPALDDLTGVLKDARPLLPSLTSTIKSADKLLVDFAPYAGDAGRFFSQHDLLSGTLGSDDKHYFAAMLTGLGLFSIAGAPDPLYSGEYYPAPGTAWNKSSNTEVPH